MTLMFTITPTAADVLNKARDEKGAPGGFGVRFFTTTAEESDSARLAFSFVESPQEGDTVLAQSPIEAYVAPEVEKVIGDVTVDTKDNGGDVGLVVRRA